MKEGTKSLLIGCHQFLIHPIFVIMAWHFKYKKWPAFWQVICIFLHDIGHWGTDYLTNYQEKVDHWQLGAKWGWKLFGPKGFKFIAGHYPEYSHFLESELALPDRYSQALYPLWMIDLFRKIEKFPGLGKETALEWRQMVIKNIDSRKPKGNHELYMQRLLVFTLKRD